jgi:hypothetical protein
MNRSLCGLALLLGVSGMPGAAQPPGPRQLSGQDARQTEHWNKQIEELLVVSPFSCCSFRGPTRQLKSPTTREE